MLVGAECIANNNSMDSLLCLLWFIASNFNFDNGIFYLLNMNRSLVNTSKMRTSIKTVMLVVKFSLGKFK